MNNNNQYSNKLYNSVFNNIVLKKIIFNHLIKFNIFYRNIQFDSYEHWEEFKYKDYLNNISFNFKFSFSKIPDNIKHIEELVNDIETTIYKLNSVPNHIESIKLSKVLSKVLLNSLISNVNPLVLSKIKKLDISLQYSEQLEINKVFPSVTELKIYGEYNEIKKEMLPRNLKRMELYRISSIENPTLLESLSNISIYNSSPSIINQLSSNSLVKLEFDVDSRFVINSDIIFPETLQELYARCYSFNAKLPNNLKSLKLNMEIFKNTIIFPSSLEHISIYILDQQSCSAVFKNRESVPCNLKSLEFPCSSIVDINGQSLLPDKLEKLIISSLSVDFNQALQVNQFPSSLTYLDLGSAFNQVIGIDVLPSSLKTLKLGLYYSQFINPLAIPQQLELLEIGNLYYEHPINLPVSTHPNTKIKIEIENFYKA